MSSSSNDDSSDECGYSRTYDGYKKESDDSSSCDSPVLPVSKFNDYDKTVPPANGQDYLRRVQLEAKEYPNVGIDSSLLSELQQQQHRLDDLILNTEEFLKADSVICPSNDWQREEVAKFMKLKQTIKQYREQFDKKKKDLNLEVIDLNANAEWWRKFCLGAKTSKEQNVASSVMEEKDGNPPLVSTVLRLSQPLTVNLLEYCINWINKYNFSHQIGLWIYALLASLNEPFDNNTYSTLRTVSRVCSKVRSKHAEISDKSLITSLNLIICVIGRYYGQLDLTDNAEV